MFLNCLIFLLIQKFEITDGGELGVTFLPNYLIDNLLQDFVVLVVWFFGFVVVYRLSCACMM